jgi:hypothetical protein
MHLYSQHSISIITLSSQIPSLPLRCYTSNIMKLSDPNPIRYALFTSFPVLHSLPFLPLTPTSPALLSPLSSLSSSSITPPSLLPHSSLTPPSPFHVPQHFLIYLQKLKEQNDVVLILNADTKTENVYPNDARYRFCYFSYFLSFYKHLFL